jgi:hypothetical protein
VIEITPILMDGKEYYALWIGSWQMKAISKAEATINAKAEVARDFQGADRRRIKREIRKAVQRRETWI